MSGRAALVRGQLAALLWLRGRLLRNQFLRGKHALQGAAGILIAVGIASGSIVIGVSCFFLGSSEILAEGEATMWVWHVLMALFALFWLIGVLTELQRSEAIDLRKLLHLPISMPAIFVLNFLASLMSPALAVFACALGGMSLGLYVRRGWLALAELPLCATLLLAVAAWTYVFRGWLVTLMENKLRRRNILTAATMIFVLLAQLPNLVNLFALGRPGRRTRISDEVRAFETRKRSQGLDPRELARRSGSYQQLLERERGALDERRWLSMLSVADTLAAVLPLGWPGLADRDLARGRVGTSALGALGGLLLTGLALGRGWRTTARHYTAADVSAPPRPPAAAPGRARTSLIERRPRFLPDDIAAMSLASLTLLLRELRFKIAMTFVPLMGLTLLVLRGGAVSPETLATFAPVSAASFAFLSVLQFATNLFGADRDGFRALVLLPTPRVRLLLARNLALLPVTFGVGGAVLAAAALAYGLPALAVLTGLVSVLTAHVLMCTAGNFFSILLPIRVSETSMARAKVGPATALLNGVLHLGLILVVVGILAASAGGAFLLSVWIGWGRLALATIVSSLGLVAAMVLYRLLLPGQGRLLESRERRILETLTRRVE